TNFSEVSSNLKDLIVFDVRNRNEVVENGQIPGSHCVPFAEFDTALSLDDSAFKEKYGFEKPPPGGPIVTHCMMGGRAMKALKALEEKGFTNVKCYSGSFKDWMENNGEVVKPGKPTE
ncbi:UNVERIFIED_CONTAM: hypothetical protein GTU68_007661, partial [Idotea baltica]|nr:hypothetical protein [Idotea baltica]